MRDIRPDTFAILALFQGLISRVIIVNSAFTKVIVTAATTFSIIIAATATIPDVASRSRCIAHLAGGVSAISAVSLRVGPLGRGS